MFYNTKDHKPTGTVAIPTNLTDSLTGWPKVGFELIDFLITLF